jgi:hypothetical protein
MNEQKQNIDAAPEWLEAAFPQKREYWTTKGTFPNGRNVAECDCWILVYYSKEDAEAASVDPGSSGWAWDGEPAHSFQLSDKMFEARKEGNKGIRVLAYVNGKWETVNEFPTRAPLPEDLR